jgi:DMSO/TMAO reductase YedYZ molybdopterin-dependent catalytic subunit
MKKQLTAILMVLGLVLTILVNPVVITYATSTDLGEVEVREYEGENLSSINAFRENSIKGPQYVDNETYRLSIGGLVENELQFTYDEILNGFETYKKVVTLFCVEGWRVTILWEGVLIEDLIKDAQVDPNATTVIFYAYDGYSTSLSLDYIIDNHIMLAYKMNNVTLPPERGYPFQLVAESKWGYKWIKWVTGIALSDNENFRGFWERAGYAVGGDLDEPYLQPFDPRGEIPEFSTLVVPIIIAAGLFVIIFRKKYSHKLAKQ